MLTIVTPATSGALVALARVKTELSISGTSQDAALGALIDEASSLIAAYCNRDTFGAEVLQQTERLTCPRDCIILARDIDVSVTSVTVDADTLTGAEHEVDGSLLYRLDDDERIAWCPGKVVVAYTAGFTLPDNAPPALSRAALDLVVGMYRATGRDPAVRQEMVEGVGSTSYFDSKAGPIPLSADRVAALARYRLVSIG